jgi:hypothetical protein
MMKRAFLIVALLLVWASGTALADYDARKSEALATLEKAEMTADERAAFKKAFDTYFTAREDCLEGLIRVVATPDQARQDVAFRDRANGCKYGVALVIKSALAEIKEPSAGALAFQTAFNSEETAFYDKLVEAEVAAARDLIVAIRLNLADMTKVLDEKWERILGDDKSLDTRAQTLIAEIRTDYNAVLKQAADAHPDAAEVIAKWVKQWAGSDTSPDPPTPSPTYDALLAAVKYALVPLIDTWEAINTRSETRARNYASMFASEIRILVMFEDVRGDVKEFLETNDWPDAEAGYAKAKSSLDAFVSNAKTSGQSRDATDLKDDLMERLAIHLRDGADVYASFVAKNNGRFVGALGPDVEKELVEHHEWERYASDLESYGLDAKLRAWHQDGTNYFGVDLSVLPSEVRDKVKTLLREIIEQLLKELKAAEAAHKAIESLIEDEREDVEKELD